MLVVSLPSPVSHGFFEVYLYRMTTPVLRLRSCYLMYQNLITRYIAGSIFNTGTL
jgi:hypothetical protein